MSEAKVTSKGQITLPKNIREHLDVKEGDKVEFIMTKTGQVLVTAKTVSLDEIYGMAKQKKKASIEDMDKAIAKAVKKRNRKK